MFWDTQVMQKALESAEKHVGPNNQYLEDGFFNMILYTSEAGKFWFGDLPMDTDEMRTAIQNVANDLDETVYVIVEDVSNMRFSPVGPGAQKMQQNMKMEKIAFLEFSPQSGEAN